MALALPTLCIKNVDHHHSSGSFVCADDSLPPNPPGRNSSHPLLSTFFITLPATVNSITTRNVVPCIGQRFCFAARMDKFGIRQRESAFLMRLRAFVEVRPATASSRNRISTKNHKRPPMYYMEGCREHEMSMWCCGPCHLLTHSSGRWQNSILERGRTAKM